MTYKKKDSNGFFCVEEVCYNICKKDLITQFGVERIKVCKKI